MSARALLLLAAGVVLLSAGCSGGVSGTAAPAPSGTPVAPPSTSAPSTTSAPPATSSTAPSTSASAAGGGAVERYEALLHAIGRQDVPTACEIAGPAAKQAEDEGFGTCEQTFPIMFGMISPAQKKALQTATIDQAQVVKKSATKVEIPVSAVKASVKFGESDLGDAVFEKRGGTWYMVD
ncbi:hypothetical protein M8542_35190 [Amycolatopsis sp. OK19-0408]|uniref:Lipoprotein n=1 Tax=Amycolatopsis iheyensis TaxID=2945988 RepID=A0A9X2NNA8_9PSEU|nr:hypothetical protein [Amycolatopsis iheyensis]MCR6488085.1 hypothetical protein [Amycolatopsis iheyensis]